MKHLITIVFLSLSALSYAQSITITGYSLPELRQPQTVDISHSYLSQSIQYLQLTANPKAALSLEEVMLRSPSQVPQAWSYQDLAFFCKLEVKLEKATSLPIKFRLGEVQYAENREGKYGSLQQQLGN